MKKLKIYFFLLFCSITVTNTLAAPPDKAPKASFEFSITDETVTFTDTSTDGGTVEGWNWDFGDSTTPSTIQNPIHTYNGNGNYNVTLNVTDNSGQTGSITNIVTISTTTTTPPTDSVIYLRNDCTNAPTPCVTSISSLLDYLWLGSVPRNPSAASPVLVDIGTGVFSGEFICNASQADNGYVTLRGSGRDNSVFENTVKAPVFVTGCKQLSFQDMTIRGATGGINWHEGGDSTYSNVAVIGDSRLGNTGLVFAWYDECNATGQKSKHTWYGSNVTSFSNYYGVAYFSFCSETWFYGGEVAAVALSGTNAIADVIAVRMIDQGDMRVFGSALKAVAQDGATFNSSSNVMTVNIGAADNTGETGGGNFHMHGGVIAADPGGPSKLNGNIDVIGIIAGDTATPNQKVHVNETGYSLSASGTGIIKRLVGTRTQSPFHWPADYEPPIIESTHGSDMFIEKDCDSTGLCNTGVHGETHLMIFSHTCPPSNPWFNVVTGACRQ